MAVNSLIRTVSPTIGGFLLEYYGFTSIGWLGVVGCVIATILSKLFIEDKPHSVKV